METTSRNKNIIKDMKKIKERDRHVFFSFSKIYICVFVIWNLNIHKYDVIKKKKKNLIKRLSCHVISNFESSKILLKKSHICIHNM